MLFRILGKMNLNTSLIIALYSLLTSCSHGYHVMFIHEMGTKSHLLQLFPMVETLLARGHEVSGVFYSPSKINHENYTEILLPNVMDEFKEEIRYRISFYLHCILQNQITAKSTWRREDRAFGTGSCGVLRLKSGMIS